MITVYKKSAERSIRYTRFWVGFAYIIFIALLSAACGKKEEHNIFFVTDSAGILTVEQEARLTEQVSELEQSIGSQIAILTIESLRGEKIEDYSLRVANKWGLGRKDYDDGVLITVAPHDHQVRVEVGYGLEKILKDEVAAQIIREQMAPNFRSEKYYEGLNLAVEKIKTLIKDNKDLVGQRD
jgi:uncharacterized protein